MQDLAKKYFPSPSNPIEYILLLTLSYFLFLTFYFQIHPNIFLKHTISCVFHPRACQARHHEKSIQCLWVRHFSNHRYNITNQPCMIWIIYAYSPTNTYSPKVCIQNITGFIFIPRPMCNPFITVLAWPFCSCVYTK